MPETFLVSVSEAVNAMLAEAIFTHTHRGEPCSSGELLFAVMSQSDEPFPALEVHLHILSKLPPGRGQ